MPIVRQSLLLWFLLHVISCGLFASAARSAELPPASIVVDADVEDQGAPYFVILIDSPPVEGSRQVLTPDTWKDVVRCAQESKRPVTICFTGHAPTVAAIHQLQPLTNLKVFACDPAVLSDEAMGAVASLRTLEHLALGNIELTAIGFAKLTNLTELRRLQISTQTPTTNPDHLRSRLRQSDFAELSKLTKLRHLHISAPIHNVALAHIGKLTELEELALDRAYLGKVGVKSLSGCRALKSLSLERNLVDDSEVEIDWSFLRTMPKLETLSYLVTRFTSSPERKVSHAGAMREITTCKQLRKLKWHVPEWVCADRFSDDDIGRLGAMTTLREIDFGATPIYSDQIGRLKLLRPECKIESLGTTKRPATEMQ